MLGSFTIRYLPSFWAITKSRTHLRKEIERIQTNALTIVQLLNHQPDDTPCVVHAKVDLLAKLDGFELLSAEDHVPRAVLHIVPGHVTKLEVVCPGQDALDGPLGQLARIILQLVGQHGTALGVQLLPPIDAAAIAGIPLVQSFQVDKLDFTASALGKICLKLSGLIINIDYY